MPRARNIKYSLFENEDLADIDPLGRLLFIGLWTIADYRGCMEYRPKRIRAQLLPYDNCDVEALCNNLEKSGFIESYSVDGKQYLKVTNFSKHQNPHKNERDKGPQIPDAPAEKQQGLDLQQENKESKKIASAPDKNETAPADSLSLIPDNLNPDNLNTSSELEESAVSTVGFDEHCFNAFWAIYPRKVSKKESLKAFLKIVKGQPDSEISRFVSFLVADVKNRIFLHQFGFDKLHASTYLNQARYDDDLVDDRVREDMGFIEKHLDSSWREGITESGISDSMAEYVKSKGSDWAKGL